MKRTEKTKTFITRTLACIMAVVMMLTIAPLSGFVGLNLGLSASAAEFTEGDYTYIVNDDGATATITSYDGAGGDIDIPSILGGYTVTVIGEYAFDSCSSLTSVTIGNSVTTIGYHAFAECWQLQNITIPDSVISIGTGAFEYCHSLASVTISNSVTTIENLTFSNCIRLESVTLPDGVTTIGSSAFDSCRSLEDVYYIGSQEQWNQIDIGHNNNPLLNATIHYNYVPHTHTYTSTVTKAATCTATGVKTYTCTICGDTYTETIAKTEHTPVTDKAVAATCLADGKTAGSHCSVCGTVITAQTTVKATGHTFSAWKTTKTATYTAAGTQTRTCSKCKATETKSIAKLKTTAISKATSTVTASVTYTGKALTPTVTVKDGKTTLKEGTHYTVKYTNNKNIGKATVTISGVEKNGYNGTKTLTFKIVPAKVTSLKAKSQTTKSITLSWKKVSGATGYVVYKYDSSKKAYVKVKATKETTYKVTDLKAGTTYKFKVRAYKKVDGSNVYGSYSSVLSTATKTAAPKVTVTAGSKKATLNWKKISGATGYQVYMATSKDGKYKKVGTVKKAATVKYTQKDLTKGKTYYFKVRTYKKVDGKNIYSAYSSVAKVKVK